MTKYEIDLLWESEETSFNHTCEVVAADEDEALRLAYDDFYAKHPNVPDGELGLAGLSILEGGAS